MEKSINIRHKEFEDGLVKLINESEIPSVMIMDVLEKYCERVKNAVHIQAEKELNIMASAQLAEAMKISNQQEDNKDEQ